MHGISFCFLYLFGLPYKYIICVVVGVGKMVWVEPGAVRERRE